MDLRFYGFCKVVSFCFKHLCLPISNTPHSIWANLSSKVKRQAQDCVASCGTVWTRIQTLWFPKRCFFYVTPLLATAARPLANAECLPVDEWRGEDQGIASSSGGGASAADPTWPSDLLHRPQWGHTSLISEPAQPTTLVSTLLSSDAPREGGPAGVITSIHSVGKPGQLSHTGPAGQGLTTLPWAQLSHPSTSSRRREGEVVSAAQGGLTSYSLSLPIVGSCCWGDVSPVGMQPPRLRSPTGSWHLPWISPSQKHSSSGGTDSSKFSDTKLCQSTCFCF